MDFFFKFMILPCAARRKDWLDRRTQWEGEISTIWKTLYVYHSPSAVCSLIVLNNCHGQMPCLAQPTVFVSQSRSFVKGSICRSVVCQVVSIDL